jgi:hypothetical protein
VAHKPDQIFLRAILYTIQMRIVRGYVPNKERSAHYGVEIPYPPS